jgi:hypothetical protein
MSVARRFVLLVVAGLALGACHALALGGADPSALKAATLVEACPLGVPGARVQKVDTAEGADVYFTAPERNREELRRRVRAQARASGPDRHQGEGHDGEHHGPRDHGLRLWSMGPVATGVEDTGAGAKLAVSPVDPSQRDALRERLGQRVAHLEAADCLRE